MQITFAGRVNEFDDGIRVGHRQIGQVAREFGMLVLSVGALAAHATALFQRLDDIFNRWNNRFTMGLVLVDDVTTLPADEPIAWRETKSRWKEGSWQMVGG